MMKQKIMVLLATLLISAIVMAGTTVITPTEDSVACTSREGTVLTFTGSGYTNDENVHFYIDNFDINNTVTTFGVPIATTGTLYADGNVLTNGSGVFVVTFNLDDTAVSLGSHSIDINQMPINNSTSEVTIYARPDHTFNNFTFTDGSTSFCTISDYTSVADFQITSVNGNIIIDFDESVDVSTAINFDLLIPETSDKRLRLDIGVLNDRSATITFSNAGGSKSDYQVFRNNSGCSICGDLTDVSAGGFQFTTTQFSTYELKSISRGGIISDDAIGILPEQIVGVNTPIIIFVVMILAVIGYFVTKK